jgi:hypothetical protein
MTVIYLWHVFSLQEQNFLKRICLHHGLQTCEQHEQAQVGDYGICISDGWIYVMRVMKMGPDKFWIRQKEEEPRMFSCYVAVYVHAERVNVREDKKRLFCSWNRHEATDPLTVFIPFSAIMKEAKGAPTVQEEPSRD